MVMLSRGSSDSNERHRHARRLCQERECAMNNDDWLCRNHVGICDGTRREGIVIFSWHFVSALAVS